HPFAEGFEGRGESERRPWDLAALDPFQAVVLVAGGQRATGDAGAVDDDDRRAGIRIHVVQAGPLDFETGLLERLAHRGVGGGLAEVDEAAGERPQAAAG